MFDNCDNSNSKGNVGLGRCLAYLTQKGYIVSLPLNDSQKYDLIFDDGINLHKVQVKTTGQFVNNCYRVKLETCTHNYNSDFNSKSTNFLFILCKDGSEYFIPSEEIKVKTALNLSTKWDKYII